MANYSYNYYIWCVYVGVIMLKSLKSIKNYIFNHCCPVKDKKEEGIPFEFPSFG